MNMETSLFSINENYPNDPVPSSLQPTTTTTTTYQQPTERDAVLQAMLSVSAGRSIMLDTSDGKKESLIRLAPQSRGLRKLINAIGSGDRVQVSGLDDAIELLDTMDDIVMNKFTIPTPQDV